jgi:hypothetical protein
MGIRGRVRSNEKVAADEEAREIVRIELEKGMVQEYGRTFQANILSERGLQREQVRAAAIINHTSILYHIY